jgi:hypothetical protein
LELKVTLHVVVLAVVQPPHEVNALLLAVVGAVRITCVPESAVIVKLVLPSVATLLLPSVYEICTPLVGFVEFTVSV